MLSVNAVAHCSGGRPTLLVRAINCGGMPIEVPEGALPWNGSPLFEISLRIAGGELLPANVSVIDDHFNSLEISGGAWKFGEIELADRFSGVSLTDQDVVLWHQQRLGLSPSHIAESQGESRVPAGCSKQL